MAVKLCSSLANENSICVRNELDKTSCTFSDIINSIEFFSNLNKYKDNDAKKITTISLQNSSIDNIPTELFRMYTKLRTLNASNVELERIEKIDFMDAKVLVSINVSYNRVSKLPSEIIQEFPRLEVLDLSYNLLSNIHRHAFDDHDIQLKFLNLSHNKLSELNFHVFINLGNLKELKLNHNYIESIKNDGHISKLTKLKKLYLQENKLTKFYPSLVQNMEVLDISWNKLHDEKFLSGNLKEMIVIGCNIAQLAVNQSLEMLEFKDNYESTLNLNGNTKMKHLEIEFKTFHHNKSLQQDINKMENLTFLLISALGPNYTEQSFTNLKKLEQLHLIRCKLKTIPTNFFKNLQQLKTLDLSENPLKVLDLNELKPLYKLEVLYLVNVRTKEMLNYQNLRTILPNLQSIFLPILTFNCSYFAALITKIAFAQIHMGNHPFLKNIEQNFNHSICLESKRKEKHNGTRLHPSLATSSEEQSFNVKTLQKPNLNEAPTVDDSDFSFTMLFYIIVSLLLIGFCTYFVYTKLKTNKRYLGRFSFTKGSDLLTSDDNSEIFDTY